MMSTQHKKGDKTIVYTKGAMDQILKHCDMILKDGKVEPLMDQDLQNIRNAAARWPRRPSAFWPLRCGKVKISKKSI
jgi:magnesium-transporting ATPase (P-type)